MVLRNKWANILSDFCGKAHNHYMGGQDEELKKGIESLPQTQFANPIYLKPDTFDISKPDKLI